MRVRGSNGTSLPLSNRVHKNRLLIMAADCRFLALKNTGNIVFVSREVMFVFKANI